MEQHSSKLPSGISLTFDDVLLDPQPADFARGENDTSTALHDTLHLKIPVLSSPMDRVTEKEMAIAMAQNGGLGIIHRNIRTDLQASMVAAVKQAKAGEQAAVDARGKLLVGAAVGPGPDLRERMDALREAGADVFLVDAAHGASKPVLEAIAHIKQRHALPVIGGSVANAKGARAVIAAGADILRIGIGAGSICTTRIVTGVGVPQLTAIDRVAIAALEEQEKLGKRITLIADGGIRQIGDMTKALAARAHAVMLGNMLAGYEESPGDRIEMNGSWYKSYRGMGSVAAMKEGSASRYGQSVTMDKSKMVPEGVEGLVPYKGPVENFLFQIRGGIQQGLFYCGSRTIEELHRKEGEGESGSLFLHVSPASMRESHPHTVLITDAGQSYAR